MRRRREWISGNQVVPLDSGLEAWTLVSGSVAVFATDKQSGQRVHLFSVEPGDPVLPVACPAESGWRVIAVPLETSCLQYQDDVEWEGTVARGIWLEKLAEAMSRLTRGCEIEPARPGKVILRAGKAIGAEEGLVFVRLDSGAGSLSGARVREGEWAVLVPGLRLEAGGAGGVEVEWTVLADPPDNAAAVLRETLDRVTAVFLDLLGHATALHGEEQRERLATRREMDRQMMARAVDALAGISGRPREAGGGDALHAALRAVAVSLGCTVKPAPYLERSADRLRALAQASGLRTRVVLLSGEWWRTENGPLVAFREDGGPVALLPERTGFFGAGRYEIFDPTAGTRKAANSATTTGLNAFARMIYLPLPEGLSTRGMLRLALASRRADLRTIVITAAGAAILAMVAPQGAAILVGQAIPGADANMIWQVAGGMAAAAFGSALFLLAQAVATLRAQSAAWQILQPGIWDHLLKLSPAYFRRFTVGQLRLRADAVTRIHQAFTADALRSIFAGVSSLLTLAIIFWYSAALWWIALGAGCVIAVLCGLGCRALYRLQDQYQDVDEALSGLVLQAVNAVSKLRVAGAANRAFAHWAIHYSRKRKLALEIRAVRDRVSLVDLAMPATATTAAFLYLLGHPIGAGPFLACMAALNAFLVAVTSAADTVAGLVPTAILWRRAQTILAASPEVQESNVHPGRLAGAIAMESVTFRYREDGPLILDNVSVRAAPGECIALTGPSGGGKSTILNLLLRFESPQSGGIYLDGREIASLDVAAVRRQIGVVTQDGRLMTGSIFDNISASGVNNMDEAWEAARGAGLAEDIEQMPMGMHTVVSEGGGNLSGGQRQRLLIARALILKPSILIFDEATSALDNQTQAIVTAELKRLRATRILVAHRLSTIRNADRIYVIEKGKVVQEGRYEALVAEPGLFAKLVSRQKA